MLLPNITLSVVNVAYSKQCCPLDDLTDVCIIRSGIYRHLFWVVRTTPVASRTIGKVVFLFVIAHYYYYYYHYHHYDYHHHITFFFFVITPHYGVSCPRAKVKHYKRIKHSFPSVSSSKSVL